LFLIMLFPGKQLGVLQPEQPAIVLQSPGGNVVKAEDIPGAFRVGFAAEPKGYPAAGLFTAAAVRGADDGFLYGRDAVAERLGIFSDMTEIQLDR
jgi:hypothetical protein